MSENLSGVLIYDGDCPFCSAASSALRRVDGVGAVAWEAESAQAFLEAQFEDVPFALVFVDGEEDSVRVGRDAAAELCGRAGVPTLVQDIVGDNYESIADAVRTVSGVDREPDPYHGSYDLSPTAHERYSDLVEEATWMPLRMPDQ